MKDCFSSAHVENAKRLLWDSCGQLLEEVNLPFYARWDSENRSQLSANIEDLVAAFDALDSKDMLPEMFCEASDLFRLPPLSLDPVAEQVNLNSRSLDMLTTSVKDLECKLSSLFSSISSAGDKANDPSTATRAASFLPPSTSPMKPTGRSTGSSTSKFDDRVLNLGLPESRSIIDDLKKTVDEIFEFLAEKPVQIKDLFRLGKRNPSPSPGARPRPVLIKVCATWDRRVLLLRKKNLQQFRLKDLFLRADVPPEHRLCQGTNVRTKSKPAAHQPSVSLAPETNAGNTSPLDSCPIQTSASPSTQSSSVTITNSSACLDSRDSGRNCCSSSPESVFFFYFNSCPGLYIIVMAPLRCCSFNCRGWNSGSLFLRDVIDSFDLLLIQEHWLHQNHLSIINEISSNFCSTSVSGMDPCSLLVGRPFGGCSIIYRKSLLSSVSPIATGSNRFCAVEFRDSGAVSYLVVCVYMPVFVDSSSHLEYLNTLGELQGFIDAQQFDMIC